MTWILFKSYIKKSFVWIKQHWQVPFIMVWTLVVYLFTRRNTDAMLEVMQAKRDSYKRQIEILRESHNDEILKREALTREYELALARVEQEFAKKSKELSKEQKTDIKEVVIKAKGNPDEINRKIEKEFGFKFVD